MKNLSKFNSQKSMLFILSWLITVLLMGNARMVWAADVTINLVAVNAADEPKEIEVKSYLPKELDPDEILDTGPLQVDYDIDKGTYYVHGMIKFAPKETKNFKLKVKDVWKVTPEEINVLKQQLEGSFSLLKKTEDLEAAKLVKERILQQIDFISTQQQNYSQNVDRRIEEYRAYEQRLNQIKNDVYNVEYLKDESRLAKETQEENKTIKLLIEVKNPSDNEEKKVKQKHYLPKEVRAEHVVDSQGFDVRYDESKERAFLQKEETFKAGETKKYSVVLKDIWQFPIKKVDLILERAQLDMKEIADSAYKDSGKFLFDSIAAKVQLIKDSQSQTLSIPQHIGLYRINQKRYEDAKKDLDHLEQLLSIVRAKKLEELESGKVKNVLQRLKALRGLQALSEALFKKGISVTMTWKIIFGAIIFIALFTASHFLIWSKRSAKMGEENAPKNNEGIKEVPKPGAPGKEAKT